MKTVRKAGTVLTWHAYYISSSHSRALLNAIQPVQPSFVFPGQSQTSRKPWRDGPDPLTLCLEPVLQIVG